MSVDIADLARRVEELERVALVGDADRPLGLAAVALQIGRSKATMTRWIRTSSERTRHRLDLLLARDASGRWISTPRKIAAWRRATETALLPAPLQRRAAKTRRTA